MIFVFQKHIHLLVYFSSSIIGQTFSWGIFFLSSLSLSLIAIRFQDTLLIHKDTEDISIEKKVSEWSRFKPSHW